MTKPMRWTVMVGLSGVLALTGCEPDDPVVREELVELRTELAAAEKTVAEQREELQHLAP